MASNIEWTDETWNVTAGCSKVSAGCANCYAETMANRLRGMALAKPVRSSLMPYREVVGHDGKWNGHIELMKNDALLKPLAWKKPRRIFVNSMSDLFHEGVPFGYIDKVFAVMALCPQHTFQVLTKRPERMAEYLGYLNQDGYTFTQSLEDAAYDDWQGHLCELDEKQDIKEHGRHSVTPRFDKRWKEIQEEWSAVANRGWPLPNVWLGTSVENQAAADERIPHLLRCPAAVRFLSCEPLLGPLDIAEYLRGSTRVHVSLSITGAIRNQSFDGFTGADGRTLTRSEVETELLALHAKGVKLLAMDNCDNFDSENGCKGHRKPRIDWVIVGGESGPGARPCDIEWIRDIVDQGKTAGVPVFVKQLGTRPWQDVPDHEFDPADKSIACGCGGCDGCGHEPVDLRDPKGGDMSEWPADLQVREFPKSGDA